MFLNSSLKNHAQKIIEKACAKNLKIVTAESCTGGLLAALLTEISGSSQVFERGFVTYSNDAKHELLGVKASTLEKFGAVSKETAREMVLGALKNSQAQIAVAITGIAGPDGGSEERPVGLVYVAAVRRGSEDSALVRKFNFAGNRDEVRLATVREVIAMVDGLV